MNVNFTGAKERMNLNWRYWPFVLRLAYRHGWEPRGTECPNEYKGVWEGRYWPTENQFVNAEDAKSLTLALNKAISRDADRIQNARLEFLSSLGDTERSRIEKLLDDPFWRITTPEDITSMRTLIHRFFIPFCSKGGFKID